VIGLTAPLDVRVNGSRLMQRLFDLADIGAIDGGGCARLALTDADKLGRDLVVEWMKDLDLDITVDVVGNVIAIWNVGSGKPVMTGSHIDTVRTGGKYDGNYGVLAGLEVIQSCQEALDTVGIDGARVGDELERIGYNGATPCPGLSPHAFVELHIEQGPVLEQIGVTIGAVTGVQGISWQEVTIEGQSNHAGTTPMSMRRDPAYVASNIAVFLRDLATRYGGHQVCTVGKIDLHPNLINVVPQRAILTLDVRNTDEKLLQTAEEEIQKHLDQLAIDEGVTITTRSLARFEPVEFDERVTRLIESIAADQGHSKSRLPSGAGHDAQMLARVCPSSMIFVPSANGISHNPAEFTSAEELEAGANVLLHTMLALANTEDFS
jgi:beta-ureidopropionase / N-carbamoyl-L-amino-acid hydrolase